MQVITTEERISRWHFRSHTRIVQDKPFSERLKEAEDEAIKTYINTQLFPNLYANISPETQQIVA